MAPCRALSSLIAFGERVGLDQVRRLVDKVILPVVTRMPDPGLGPQMVVFVDAHIALGRLGKLDARRGFLDLVDIETAGQRAADLSRQMLAYSGRGRFVIQSLNLNSVVREMTHLLHSSIGKNIRLNYQLAETLALVDAEREDGQGGRGDAVGLVPGDVLPARLG